MKNLCKAKGVTRGCHVHWWFCLLLVLGFTAGLAAGVRADYTRPTTKPPTNADLTMIEGRSKTLAIRVLNLTPYELVGTSLIQQAGYTNTDRNTHKKFMFAPLGIPKVVPGLHGTWGQDPVTKDWVFTPSSTGNESMHPYNFVVSWDDQGGYGGTDWLTWTVKNVYPQGHGTTKDVPLRFWITRVTPSNDLTAATLRLLSSIAKLTINAIAANVTGGLAWVHYFLAETELLATSFEADNSRDDYNKGGNKMYFAAYTIPDCPTSNTTCTGYTQGITLSEPGETSDGVDVQWPTMYGDYFTQLVVTTYVLRGYDDYYFSNSKVPIVHVIVWTWDEYLYATTHTAAASTAHPLGQQLKAALGTPDDLSRYTQFAFLCKSLNSLQQQTFQETIKALLFGDPLTKQEEVLLEKMIAALLKGQTKLSPANR